MRKQSRRMEDNSQFKWGTPVVVASVKGEKTRRGAVVTKRPLGDAKSLAIQ